jgi:hypothetical protein
MPGTIRPASQTAFAASLADNAPAFDASRRRGFRAVSPSRRTRRSAFFDPARRMR